MDLAETVVGRSRRQRFAPGHGRFVPLGGAAQVGGVEACRHRHTEDPSGDDVAELTREHVAHRLVEPGHARGGLPIGDQQAPLELEAHGDDVPAAASLPDLGHAFGQLQRAVDIAAAFGRLRLAVEDESAFGALGPCSREPLGPLEPPC